MADENKKQERQSLDREWWENLLGIYRDERIDEINLRAGRYAFYILVVQLFIVGGIAVYFGDWQGWLTLGVVTTAVLFLFIRHRQFSADGYDEWTTRQMNKLYLILGSGLLLWPIIIGIFTSGNTDTAVWTSTIILPLFAVASVQVRQRAYPWQTWALSAVLAVAGGYFGYQLGAGNMSPTVAWTMGIIYVLIVIASLIYYFRQ